MSPKEDEAKQPQVRTWPTVVTLLYANFWMAATVSLQAPFFPREAEMKGATASEYGFVFGIYELVVIIMSPIYGKLIPRVPLKILLSFGVILGGVACCAFGLLDLIPPGRLYIACCFLVRIFEGIGAAAVMTCSFTIVAALYPHAVATMFSLVEMGFGLGLIVGPSIGGALYQWGGFMLPFVVVGLFVVAGCPFIVYVMHHVGDAENNRSSSVLGFLLDLGIISFACSIVTSLLFIGFNAATLEPHLRQFKMAPIALGFVFVITGAIYALTTPLWGRLCDSGVNPRLLNCGGYLMTCIGIMFIGPIPFVPFQATLATVIGSLVVIGLGLSAKLVSSFVGSIQNTQKRGFPDNLSTYSMVSALMSTTCSIGAFIGPSIGGVLLDTIKYQMATAVIFGIEVFFMLFSISAVIVEHLRQRSEDPEKHQHLCDSQPRKSYDTLS